MFKWFGGKRKIFVGLDPVSQRPIYRPPLKDLIIKDPWPVRLREAFARALIWMRLRAPPKHFGDYNQQMVLPMRREPSGKLRVVLPATAPSSAPEPPPPSRWRLFLEVFAVAVLVGILLAMVAAAIVWTSLGIG